MQRLRRHPVHLNEVPVRRNISASDSPMPMGYSAAVIQLSGL